MWIVGVFDYVTVDDALVVVDRLGFTIADFGLFASAIARPATSLFGADAYPDLATKAAALMHSLARNHALPDGNKRIAWVLTSLMLALNGYELDVDEADAETFMLDVAQGFVEVEAMAKWLSDHLR